MFKAGINTAFGQRGTQTEGVLSGSHRATSSAWRPARLQPYVFLVQKAHILRSVTHTANIHPGNKLSEAKHSTW